MSLGATLAAIDETGQSFPRHPARSDWRRPITKMRDPVEVSLSRRNAFYGFKEAAFNLDPASARPASGVPLVRDDEEGVCTQ